MTNEAVMEKYHSMVGKFTEKEIAESMELTVAQLRKIKSKYTHEKYLEMKERVKLAFKKEVPIYIMAENLGIPVSTARMYVNDLRKEGAIEV